MTWGDMFGKWSFVSSVVTDFPSVSNTFSPMAVFCPLSAMGMTHLISVYIVICYKKGFLLNITLKAYSDWTLPAAIMQISSGSISYCINIYANNKLLPGCEIKRFLENVTDSRWSVPMPLIVLSIHARLAMWNLLGLNSWWQKCMLDVGWALITSKACNIAHWFLVSIFGGAPLWSLSQVFSQYG